MYRHYISISPGNGLPRGGAPLTAIHAQGPASTPWPSSVSPRRSGRRSPPPAAGMRPAPKPAQLEGESKTACARGDLVAQRGRSCPSTEPRPASMGPQVRGLRRRQGRRGRVRDGSRRARRRAARRGFPALPTRRRSGARPPCPAERRSRSAYADSALWSDLGQRVRFWAQETDADARPGAWRFGPGSEKRIPQRLLPARDRLAARDSSTDAARAFFATRTRLLPTLQPVRRDRARRRASASAPRTSA